MLIPFIISVACGITLMLCVSGSNLILKACEVKHPDRGYLGWCCFYLALRWS